MRARILPRYIAPPRAVGNCNWLQQRRSDCLVPFTTGRARRQTAHRRRKAPEGSGATAASGSLPVRGGSVITSGRRGDCARIILPPKASTGASREQSCHTSSNAAAGPTSGQFRRCSTRLTFVSRLPTARHKWCNSNRTDQVEMLRLYAGSPGDSPDERTLWQTRKRQPKAAR